VRPFNSRENGELDWHFFREDYPFLSRRTDLSSKCVIDMADKTTCERKCRRSTQIRFPCSYHKQCQPNLQIRVRLLVQLIRQQKPQIREPRARLQRHWFFMGKWPIAVWHFPPVQVPKCWTMPSTGICHPFSSHFCTIFRYNVCIFAYGQTGSGKSYTMSQWTFGCQFYDQ
jgi:hypothetical protein